MAKLGNIAAIKRYLELADKIAPNGGRTVQMGELKGLSKPARAELGELCLVELREAGIINEDNETVGEDK
jgi:hypothetical protein